MRIHYWAAARAAAGAEAEDLEVDGPITVAEVRRRLVERHPGTNLADVLAVCSVLIGDRPVGRQDAAEVEVPPEATVEFLPPFAGG